MWRLPRAEVTKYGRGGRGQCKLEVTTLDGPPRGIRVRVVSSRPLTPTTHAIQLEKPETFAFRATQFTFLQLRTEEGMDARPMSLATSPTRPHLEYAVRLSDSPYKRAFASLRPGDEVRVFGPIGDFVLHETRPAVLLAGGIGITPFKGMAEYAADKRTGRCVIRHGMILTSVPRACGGKPRSHRTRSAPFEPWSATTRPRIWRPSLRAHTTRAPRSSAACSGLARSTIVW